MSSAKVVLLARDAGPLLAMRTPATVAPNTRFDVVVSCYNPSGKKFTGTLMLDPTGGCLPDPFAVEVKVEPWGKTEVTYSVIAGARPGRAVFSPMLDAASPVEGIPHDVYIVEPRQ